jgi:RNA polymerase sigma factor (sigma-70 family)
MDKKDYRLIEKCKSGNSSAKEWLYRTYSPVLLGVCRRYINNRMQAEDIVHESFITIYEKISELRQESSLEGWMKRIVINNSLKFLKNREFLSDIDEISESDIDVSVSEEGHQMKDQLLQLDISQEDMLSVIDSLPAGFRAVFNLYVFENYSHNEIADELGISSSTSRSQLLRARKMIQKKLVEKMEQHKRKEKEKICLVPLLIMNDDLSYIDQIAFSKLNGYKIVPGSSPTYLNQVKGSAGKTVAQGAKAKMALFAGKNIIWVSTLLVGVTGITLAVCLQNDKKNEEKIPPIITVPSENQPQPVVSPDTAKYIAAPEHQPDTVKKTIGITSEKPNDSTVLHGSVVKKEIVHKKVLMKKVVTVKKEEVVADTIRKIDTLSVK